MSNNISFLSRRKFLGSIAIVGVASLAPSFVFAGSASKITYIKISKTTAQRLNMKDHCAQCGMMITKFPGPKGEAYLRNNEKIRKFCSTRDLFSFILDPEYIHQVKKAYVHDMTGLSWDAPNDERFIDAKLAFYVLKSSKKGAMGSTLASFGSKTEADKFQKLFGGKVYVFKDITMDLV